MVDADVFLYLVSQPRIARLQKRLSFSVLPRLREFVKVRNREEGDYFAFSVVQVTHREDDVPELWLQLTSLVGGRSVVSFVEDDELDEFIESYKQEGWILASLVPNRTFRDTGEPIWSEMAESEENE